MLGRKPQMPSTRLCFVTATMRVTEDGKLNEIQSQPQEANRLVESLVIPAQGSHQSHILE